MNDKEIQKLQQLVSELPSAPKEGSLVNIDEVFDRLNAIRCVIKTEDESWELCRKHMVDGLMGMPSEQRLKVLEETKLLTNKGKSNMLKPLRNQIIVKPTIDTEEKKSAGGIVIPGTVVEGKYKYGTVVAVGPGYLLETGVLKVPDVKVDDVVLHGTGFAEVVIDNEKFLVMADDNCLAVK